MAIDCYKQPSDYAYQSIAKPIDCYHMQSIAPKGNRLLIAILTISGRMYVLHCKPILNTFLSLKTCIKHKFIYIK